MDAIRQKALFEAIAGEQFELAHRVEALGVTAASDSRFATANIALLQECDLIAQTQAELGKILRRLVTHDIDDAIAHICLDALHARLSARSMAELPN